MSEDWKVGYKRAVLSAFAKSAVAKSENEEYYSSLGGIDYELDPKVHDHLQVCEIDLELTELPDDSQWETFHGTFYEGDETEYGMDTTITCKCGQVKGVGMRMSGTFGEFLRSVLEED